ncbi:hybrid sensor histidine kinase/response regulator transcription factor [Seonamhaeicola maritimus]|uniref:histidine kinase n=1 Tax=Seonamhaeicola maritimus TaxID=2591822 RepID=A0A5C7GJV1_9FLAO|nr:hybrid sensor histidine kinase/response regulator transcription factor [Seonamhaeicola maritimus]TXG38648.1 response regulator [Seonamhaeicola maritimus]
MSSISIFGQAPELKFEHFVDEKGLAQNSIMNVLQDLDGFLWIGTPNGLYKYDGNQYKVYRHQTNDSLSISNNSIYELELDIHGNILIGTGSGLCKFDRLKETFSTFPGDLKNGRISAIYPEKDGGLWVGTLHSGLYHLKADDSYGNDPEHYTHQLSKSTSIDSDKVQSITKDHEGNLWVGTFTGLNKMYETKSGNGFLQIEEVNEEIKSLFVDERGELWIGLRGARLFRIMDPANFKTGNSKGIKKYAFNNDVGNDISEISGLIAINKALGDNLWLGIHGYGLCWFNPETEEFKLYIPNVLNPESISSNNVETILVDRTNVLWVGTEEGGLNKCDLEKKNILFFGKNGLTKNSLSDPSVNAIISDTENSIMVATQNGLNKIVFDDGSYENPSYKHLYVDEKLAKSDFGIKQPVYSIIKDKDDDYWLGCSAGIVHMKADDAEKKFSFTATGLNMNEVFSVLEDSNGVLWFGSMLDGLVKWKKKLLPNSNQFDFSNAVHYLPNPNDKYSINAKEITCIYEDRKGNVWVGTQRGGINLVVPGKKGEPDRFVSYQHNPEDSNSLSHNSVYSIHEDALGNFWIGTFGGGLNKMTFPLVGDAAPTFKHYTEHEGLADNAVYGILEDGTGKLWISTDHGISYFDPKKEVFKNLRKDDGLQSNNFRMNAYFKNKNGYLLFGGLRGLNIFHPSNLKENTIPPEVKITSLKIKNEEIKVGQEYNGRVILNKSLSHINESVNLKHHENTLTFEFAALHYAVPEKNNFRFKLEGFDKEWESRKNISFAHYTNLSPGNYVFKVQASNNDGFWTDEDAILELKINPPFWLTNWAYLLYTLLFLAFVWSINSYSNMKSQQKASLKLQKEIEEVNRLKLQFFTNISHELKTPITLILNPLEEVLESVSNNIDLKSSLKIIQRNANSLLRLVNQLMEFRKIEVGETQLRATKSNLINFVREITFSFRASAKKKRVEISFESQLYDASIWFDWDKLEKILNNLIYNAIKFTTSEGEITVRVKKPKHSKIDIVGRELSVEYIQIEIEDNGIGIHKDKLPYIFQRFYQVNQTSKKNSDRGSGIGLAITKDLVDLHHGSIEVDSEENKGTCFTIKLPLGNEHLLSDEMVEISSSEPLSEEEMDESFDANDEQGYKKDEDRYTILVVDDNDDIRTIVKNGLVKKYHVLEAIHGKEALNVALKEMPDLIITDVLMPEMDGIEFCTELRNNLRTSHIPIIMLTALNSVEHRIKGVESGADVYIPKPFNMKLLEVRTDKLIESREIIRKRFQTEKELTPEEITLNSLDEGFLNKIMSLMEENMADESYWIDELAADMNTSRSTFFRKLKKLTGQTPNEFIRLVRLKRAAQLLEQNKLNIAQVSYMVGFNDPNYFGKCFKKFFGESPSSFIKKTTVS